MLSTPPRRAAPVVVAVLLAALHAHGVLTAPGTSQAAALPPSVLVATDTVTTPPPFTGCQFKGARPVRRGPANSRRVALTFDDGPSAYTAKILDVLARAHVPATFFVLGDHVAGEEALLHRMLAEGHMIGNHSFTHRYLNRTTTNIAREIRMTQNVIAAATGGFVPCLLRPPFGGLSQRVIDELRRRRLGNILWTVNPVDYTNPGSATIRRTILAGVEPGAIVVDHDGGNNRGQTVKALPEVISALKARGYRFVTVTDLLGLKLTG